ncbi:hypothetical protein HY620_00480 [Candidatus Uhrbacteria bacterium]|nr:hypothetical protein [Candidatus Uhrbacteria bacterium]
MKKLIQKILFYLARAILKKYHPQVVGITGSVGKTSVKDAVSLVVSKRYPSRATEKNYNNEIGVPLTIIGANKSPGKSLIRWFGIIVKAVSLLVWKDKKYPQMLVLEMGADKPGDIRTLTQLAPCTIGIITALAPAHMEFFPSFEALEWEKKEMYRHLTSSSCALVNIDDPLLAKEKDALHSRVFTYGTQPNADVYASDVSVQCRFLNGVYTGGACFFVTYSNQTVRIELPSVSSVQMALATLPAVAVGSAFQIPLETVADALRDFHQPQGRMRILSGIKRTLLIDDTYNSSPLAARAALDTLRSFEIDESSRRIAVLGDMRELGESSKSEHYDIGRYVAEKGVDILVTVGKEANEIGKGARDAGLNNDFMLHFDDADSAKIPVQNLLKKGDCVLIKGSQAVRLEKVVEEVMAEPQRAKELLVRQGSEWK